MMRRSAELKQRIAVELADAVIAVVDACEASLRRGGKLMFCGNGGSAADSQHLATELLIRLRGSVRAAVLAGAGADAGSGGADRRRQRLRLRVRVRAAVAWAGTGRATCCSASPRRAGRPTWCGRCGRRARWTS